MNNSFKTALVSFALAAVATTAVAQDSKSIAIATIVEVPALTETRDGILAALADRGYVEGENLNVDYQNANGNMPTQQQIAKKFVGDAPDVIIPITTPTSQAMAAATSDIPIVFATVTDPIKASLITQYEKPGANVTGVSDAAPIAAQMDMFEEIVPGLSKIGFIYNPGLDNALATLGWIKEEGEKRGITVVESPAPTTNEVILATKKLIGEVDAIYVPNDTTIVAALEAIVKIGQDVDMPIFTGETGGVERGALASVGLDYVAVGRVAGDMAADILEGKSVSEIDAVIAYNVVDHFKVVVNLGAAERMAVKIPESVMSRATQVIE
ncbi:ABC transporter substrate-binding protein [Parasedimentitalea huanghaiensis]|uniref:ABC transporter permease n=1 Tax=Parasedimentitalea huanghaiensis TaxID=2682100 RepID=A0A6L6WL60_9RHOB|nr:ABC transporter substrate-binding protein [Zongyanglinia huanghaiensis]MVO17345.1 ABC transporter permease [Zongyanglinia huanghaiensis]